jgi:hypothetical protein
LGFEFIYDGTTFNMQMFVVILEFYGYAEPRERVREADELCCWISTGSLFFLFQFDECFIPRGAGKGNRHAVCA